MVNKNNKIIKQFNNLKLKNKNLIQPFINLKALQLKSLSFGIITEKQLETVRQTFSRQTEKTLELHIKIKPTLPTTEKPAESRMGKGRGKFRSYIYYIRPGQTILEIKTVLKNDLIMEIVKSVQKKLPCKIKAYTTQKQLCPKKL